MPDRAEQMVSELLYAHHQWSLAKFVDNASRAAVLAKKESFHEARKALIDALEQADRTCHMIRPYDSGDNEYCSKCNRDLACCGGDYCSGCGARIIESEE